MGTSVVAIEKGAFWSHSTTVANFTYNEMNCAILESKQQQQQQKQRKNKTKKKQKKNMTARPGYSLF